MCQKMPHLRTFVEKRILNLVPNGTKVSIWSQKVQILLTSPKFFRFPHFFSTFPGFLGFSQFFSVVFRFSKVLHKSSRLHRGTNMTRNSGLEKVPILLTSPKFLSFPRPKNNRKLPKTARKTTKTCPHYYKKRIGGS